MGLEQLCIAETHLRSSHLFPIYAPQLLLHNLSSKPTGLSPSLVSCAGHSSPCSLLVLQHPQDRSAGNSCSKTAGNLDPTVTPPVLAPPQALWRGETHLW